MIAQCWVKGIVQLGKLAALSPQKMGGVAEEDGNKELNHQPVLMAKGIVLVQAALEAGKMAQEGAETGDHLKAHRLSGTSSPIRCVSDDSERILFSLRWSKTLLPREQLSTSRRINGMDAYEPRLH
jgi:hypothetical protein